MADSKGGQCAPFEDCPKCGYSLSGLPAGHNCPECGLYIDEATVFCLSGLRKLYWRQIRLAILLTVLIMPGVIYFWSDPGIRVMLLLCGAYFAYYLWNLSAEQLPEAYLAVSKIGFEIRLDRGDPVFVDWQSVEEFVYHRLLERCVIKRAAPDRKLVIRSKQVGGRRTLKRWFRSLQQQAGKAPTLVPARKMIP